MSQRRVFEWTCDFCGDPPGAAAFVVQTRYGLPPGWKWLPSPEGVKHICDDCQEQGKHGGAKLRDSGKLS